MPCERNKRGDNSASAELQRSTTMDITKDNFGSTVDKVCDLLRSCDYYAIDLEMTGIDLPGRAIPEDPCMSPNDLYRIKREVASRFSIIQVGLCTFHQSPVGSPPALKGNAAAGASSRDGGGTSTGSTDENPPEGRETSTLCARPFNFFVFPAVSSDLTFSNSNTPAEKDVLRSRLDSRRAREDRRNRHRDVILSPDAVGFLRQHGMDFQRWVYQGVACADERRERDIVGGLTARDSHRRLQAQTTFDAALGVLSDVERTWVAESVNRARQFAGGSPSPAASGPHATGAAAPSSWSVLALTREEALPSIRSANAVHALRLAIAGDDTIPGVIVQSRRSAGGGGGGARGAQDAVLVRQTADEAASLLRREALDHLGFRTIFKAMVECKRPVVGHNCFVDWLFLLNTFDGPLPATLQVCTRTLHEYFPIMFDTKMMAGYANSLVVRQQPRTSSATTTTTPCPTSPPRFENTHLGGLFDAYMSLVRSPIPPDAASDHLCLRLRRNGVPWLPLGFHSYAAAFTVLPPRVRDSKENSAAAAAHEAGYDALMTGTVFSCLLTEFNHLAKDASPAPLATILQGRGALFSPPSLTNEPMVAWSVNKLALFRSLYCVRVGEDGHSGATQRPPPADDGDRQTAGKKRWTAVGASSSSLAVVRRNRSSSFFLPAGGVVLRVDHAWGGNFALLEAFVKRACQPPSIASTSTADPPPTPGCGGATVGRDDGPNQVGFDNVEKYATVSSVGDQPKGRLHVQFLYPVRVTKPLTNAGQVDGDNEEASPLASAVLALEGGLASLQEWVRRAQQTAGGVIRVVPCDELLSARQVDCFKTTTSVVAPMASSSPPCCLPLATAASSSSSSSQSSALKRSRAATAMRVAVWSEAELRRGFDAAVVLARGGGKGQLGHKQRRIQPPWRRHVAREVASAALSKFPWIQSLIRRALSSRRF